MGNIEISSDSIFSADREYSNLVILDSSLSSYRDLAIDNRDTKTVLLNNGYEFEQITEILSYHQNLNSVSIVSHGDNAQIQIGKTSLNSANLDTYEGQIKSWGNALSSDGDFLLFGCNIAAKESGQNFVNRIAELTSKDVAASTDITGTNGNWTLEYTAGKVESSIDLNSDADVSLAVKEVTRTPSPYQELLFSDRSILGRTDVNWDFEVGDYNLDGKQDIFAINRKGVDSTEVHILDGATNYQSFLLQNTNTVLRRTKGSWDFEIGDYNLDGKQDIFAINRQGVDSTAVHILDGATNYDTWLLHSATALEATEQTTRFALGDYNQDNQIDLFAIAQNDSTNSTEIQVLDGADRYKSKLLEPTAILPAIDKNWEFEIEDYNADNQVDIIAIDRQGDTGTEVHVLDGSTNYNDFLLQTHTRLGKSDRHWEFAVADLDNDGQIDIFGINRRGETPSTEVTIVRQDTLNYYWSDLGIWGGELPTENDEVIISSERQLILDTSATVKSLQIDGVLIAEDSQDLDLTADWILVDNGRFQVGTQANPHQNNFTLTLEGDDPDLDIEHLGITDNNAFLMARGVEGAIELHGASSQKVSWTQLGATANVGSNTITLKEKVNWEIGNQIVIASTDFDFEQAEERTIVDISDDGTTITLDRPLVHRHFGELQSYSNDERTWELDERAEVGLLSRNIKIQGDADSIDDGIGGHMMIMMGADAYIEGVEFTRMGQKGIVGRYPFHWHLRGDATGQYIANSSIHHTFNRAISVHGTHNTLVKNNVAYENLGHAYFLEDGIETGNIFDGNLGLSTRRPDPEDGLLNSDISTHRFLTGPSTFWITNPDNTFINNVVAGSQGSSYWFAFPEHPTGLSATDTVWPRRTPLKEFHNNTSHSSEIGINIDGFDLDLDGSSGGAWKPVLDPSDRRSPSVLPEFTNFTGYKHLDTAIWSRGGTEPKTFSNSILADNSLGFFSGTRDILKDSLVVGGSDNYSFTPPDIRGHVSGVGFYNGSTKILNSHFTNFDLQDNMQFFHLRSSKGKVVFELDGVTGDNSSRMAIFDRVNFEDPVFGHHFWTGVIVDRDGSLTGRPNSTLVADHPMMIDGDMNPLTDYLPESNAWISDNRYGHLDLNGAANIDTIITRVEDEVSYTRNAGTDDRISVILGKDYTYRYDFLSTLPETFSFQFTPNSGRVGDYLYVEVPDVLADASIYYDEQQLQPLASLTEVYTSNSVAYAIEDDKLLMRLPIDRLNQYREPTSAVFEVKTNQN